MTAIVTGGARRLLRVRRNSGDLPRAVAFYREALGFEILDTGVDATASRLVLGEQELVLVASGPRGRPYPPHGRCCDPWFQHLAIVVADMEAAYAHLRRYSYEPITRGGPQQLPPNTGAVAAFKFRDPDGHPLELLHFPRGSGDPRWQEAPGLFLGIDHAAIVVASAERSIAFYERLGFSVAARSINTGPEQARLDNLAEDVRVEVVALQPITPGPPHVELLAYQRPRGATVAARAQLDDIAADQLVLETDDLAATTATLRQAGAAPLAVEAGTSGRLVRDPDGHLLHWIQPT